MHSLIASDASDGAASAARGRRPRLRLPELEERVLRTAQELLIDQGQGLSVGLDHINLEVVIAASGVPRSSAYRRWPTKEDFVLDFLESKGVHAPYSCREGECSACAIRLLEGEVTMVHNDVLDDEDLADGIRLGCQSVPATDTVRATYS